MRGSHQKLVETSGSTIFYQPSNATVAQEYQWVQKVFAALFTHREIHAVAGLRYNNPLYFGRGHTYF